MKLHFVIRFNCAAYFSQLECIDNATAAEIRNKRHSGSSRDSVLKILKLRASS